MVNMRCEIKEDTQHSQTTLKVGVPASFYKPRHPAVPCEAYVHTCRSHASLHGTVRGIKKLPSAGVNTNMGTNTDASVIDNMYGCSYRRSKDTYGP